MPHRMTELLRPSDRPQFDAAASEEPEWLMAAGVSGALLVVGMAAATFWTSYRYVESPAILGVLLFLASAPFVLQLFVKRVISPAWSLAVLAVLHLLGSPLGLWDPIHDRDQVSLMILVWLVGATASIGNRREIAFVTIGAFGLTIGRSFADPAYGSPFVWSLAVGLALAAGSFIRTLSLALFNAKVAQKAMEEQATTAERQRIAREVHDVIAHSLTVTMLHLTAARLAVGRGDSTAATEALEEAEKAGRTSLNEIRHTVGLLRGDGGPETAPQPAADDVPTLVEGYRAAGVDVAVDLVGDLGAIEPAAGLALYRIVQESLTNASRHAPGAHTTVHIDTGPPLRVDVRSEGGTPAPSRGSGLGLAGMAERASALGGLFEAGPHRNGWRVAATLP